MQNIIRAIIRALCNFSIFHFHSWMQMYKWIFFGSLNGILFKYEWNYIVFLWSFTIIDYYIFHYYLNIAFIVHVYKFSSVFVALMIPIIVLSLCCSIDFFLAFYHQCAFIIWIFHQFRSILICLARWYVHRIDELFLSNGCVHTFVSDWATCQQI